jgi:ferredoxin-NADP reductase
VNALRSNTIRMRVHATRWESAVVNSVELRAEDGTALPTYFAGAHIDLHLPIGQIRSYSLCGDPDDHSRYLVAVNRDPHSRGGSQWIHDHLRVGHVLEVSAPRNHFPLVEDAENTVFIAGGIGITPLLAMARTLNARRRPWELHLAVRTRDQTAFTEELTGLASDGHGSLHIHVDAESGGAVLDIAGLLQRTANNTHLYCCGPTPMIEAFLKAAADRPAEHVHVEYFSASQEVSVDGGFEVELVQSGVELQIPPGQSILDAVLSAGVYVDYSCKEGICGSCEVRIVEGVADHRDSVLSKKERDAQKSMMICCSGSKLPRLVLDI